MTRIRDLEFPHRSALYRGDGSGVAVVLRSKPLDAGSCWASVETPGSGIGDGFLYLETRGGGDVEGTPVLQVFAFSVAGDADDERPDTWSTHLDPRLTSLGEYVGVEDPDRALDDDRASAAKRAADAERVRADTLTTRAVMDGRDWTVTIPPTFGNGTTHLSCTADDDGEVRRLETREDRSLLERATRVPTTIEAVRQVRRRVLGGTRAETVRVTLHPAAE